MKEKKRLTLYEIKMPIYIDNLSFFSFFFTPHAAPRDHKYISLLIGFGWKLFESINTVGGNCFLFTGSGLVEVAPSRRAATTIMIFN